MENDGRAALRKALPAYEIEGKLGEGAFGVVYEARHAELGRRVAIKQLPPSFAENTDVRGRFVAEAQMVASLNHPHVVPVYDFVESEGSRFLIMERCQGSISDRFKSEGLVTDESCAAILACLAALDVAHRTGLLHRDVKPENLLYDTDGVVKLADFGIARDLAAETRRTATGMIIGTPAYMSPEQCRGDELTPASDIYSVAVMGYELLTGDLPFPDTGSVNGLIAHHLVTEPTPLLTTRPELHGSIGEVIDRALNKDLALRYSSAIDFATALAQGCVTAFGSGWIRRRRFTLHWPEIIAETERPSSSSPRTGTILVRAGRDPQPVNSERGAADLPTIQMSESAQLSEPQISEPQNADVTPTPPASHAAAAASGRSSGIGSGWLGAGIAALIAVVVGFFLLSGADNDPTVDEPLATAVAETANEAENEDRRADIADIEPTAEIGARVPAQAAPETTTAETPVATPTPFVLVITERPDDIDSYDASSPFAPTPCPTDQERVACIFAAVVVDEENGELLVPYFTEGFVPQLEPADYHVHFYLDTFVDGDETRAGRETPGGAWKPWDAPYPATSFGGENGRTLYTLSDYVDTDARNLCAIVSDAEQRAIPGSGNCAPLSRPNDVEDTLRVVNRLQGQFIGSCSIGATAIVPDDWRWFDLTATTLADAARQIQPTAAAEAEQYLGELVNVGGVVWADGPTVDEYVVNLSLSIYSGDFTLTSTPEKVQTTFNSLGIATADAEVRTVEGRDLLISTISDRGLVSVRYVVPDFGYATVMTFTAPTDAGLDALADQMAATVSGC